MIGRRMNLPRQWTSFIGRERELAEVPQPAADRLQQAIRLVVADLVALDDRAWSQPAQACFGKPRERRLIDSGVPFVPPSRTVIP
jgi:hypothetical protein